MGKPALSMPAPQYQCPSFLRSMDQSTWCVIQGRKAHKGEYRTGGIRLSRTTLVRICRRLSPYIQGDCRASLKTIPRTMEGAVQRCFAW